MNFKRILNDFDMLDKEKRGTRRKEDEEEAGRGGRRDEESEKMRKLLKK